MKKKILSLALALVMCLGLTVPAFASGFAPESFHVSDETIITFDAIKWSDPAVVKVRYEAYTGVWDDNGLHDVPTGEMIENESDAVPIAMLRSGSNFTVTDEATKVDSSFFLDSYLIWNEKIQRFDEYFVENEIRGGLTNDMFYVKDKDGNTVIADMIYFVGGGIYMEGEPTFCYCVLEGSQASKQFGFDTSDEPSQPANPDAPAYQVSGWAAERVALAVKTGLAPEGLGNDYRVNITRAQFAATAVKLYEAMSGKTLDPVTDNPFTDTTDPVILQAADMGFVSGVGGGRFDPEALVNREQAAVMLSSVYTKLGGSVPTVAATTFADNGDVSGWAKSAVAFMNGKEIVTGVGNNNFSPKGNASIEQALLISLKMFETLK